MLRFISRLGEFVLRQHLFRHGLRRATFPKGEGMGTTAPEQQTDKPEFDIFPLWVYNGSIQMDRRAL